MAGRQAKLLSDLELARLLAELSRRRHPLRNRVIGLLSFKAGLRAAEISKLDWSMVLDASGAVASTIVLENRIVKGKKRGRIIPMHPELRSALEAWKRVSGGKGPVARSERGGRMTPVSLVNFFKSAFVAVGLSGCSSHSGRRTFITKAARAVHRAGGSLRDVQALAGHASIQTTERYIDYDTDAQRRLVALI
jgi:integrase/recombinase XerD